MTRIRLPDAEVRARLEAAATIECVEWSAFVATHRRDRSISTKRRAILRQSKSPEVSIHSLARITGIERKAIRYALANEREVRT
jgi:hypothetical protein